MAHENDDEQLTTALEAVRTRKINVDKILEGGIDFGLFGGGEKAEFERELRALLEDTINLYEVIVKKLLTLSRS